MAKIYGIIAAAFAVIFGLFRHEKRRADTMQKKQEEDEAVAESKSNSFSHIQKELKEAQNENTDSNLKPDTDYSL